MAAGWDLLRNAARGVGDARDRFQSPRMQFEFRRKAWHILGAVAAVPILLVFGIAWALVVSAAAIAVIAMAWWMEVRRTRHGASRAQGSLNPLDPVGALTEPVGKALQSTRRSDETFPWASVTFLLALAAVGLVVALANLNLAYAFAAFGILGFGDAASAIIGVAYGAHRLAWNTRKSWEGIAAGALVGFLGAVVLAVAAYTYRGAVFPAPFLVIFGLAAVVGAFLESLPGLQDNWTVPVGSLATMILAARAFGMGV
jgi:dolichol kinase